MIDKLAAALDTLDFGVALLDRNGHVTSLNHAAARMCRDRSGICRCDHSLGAAWAPDERALNGLALRACGWPGSRDSHPLLLHDDAGNPVAVAFVHSLHRAEETYRSDPPVAAVLFIRSLDGQTKLTQEGLRSLFRLTQAQVSLAVALHAGTTLAGANRGLDRSISTLGKLRDVFAQTNLRREAERSLAIERVAAS